MAVKTLPSFAPYPAPSLRASLSPHEWNASLEAWTLLTEAYVALSDEELQRIASRSQSLPLFLTSLLANSRPTHGASCSNSTSLALLKACHALLARLLRSEWVPRELLDWDLLADFSHVYGKARASKTVALISGSSWGIIEASLLKTKQWLSQNLDLGISGDLKGVEEQLNRLNRLLHASPRTAAFFLTGSDFMDGLVTCYKVMNPPLRSSIVTTTYLCLLGLTESEPPKISLLTDQLYSLKAAADAHKAGPLNVNDSLVAELVSATPFLRVLQNQLDASQGGGARAKTVLQDLAAFKKAGQGLVRPRRLIRRRIDKGKGKAAETHQHINGDEHVHRMSQITQIQDLFPELGSGFVSKLLDEYKEDSETVVARLLEDSLPPHLQSADRTEQLSTHTAPNNDHNGLVPRSTPPPPTSALPIRRNVFDNDALDRLAVPASRLHTGKRNPHQTADHILADRSSVASKAAILSALAAFDSDDDERDDTYDVEDVGGAVIDGGGATELPLQRRRDGTAAEAGESGGKEEKILWKAYQSNSSLFSRDQNTRRAQPRQSLKAETHMTDEAIEGWAIMLTRDPKAMRRLEMKYSAPATFRGQDAMLERTAWRGNGGDSDTEGGSGMDGGPRQPGMNRGRGRGRGRGGPSRGGEAGGRGGGNVAGKSGDQDTEAARRRKEANKGQRANHNRREGRARKMARGGFAG